MKITADFLDKGRTAKGGWTRKQLEALGLSWPPKAGWKELVIGTEISDRRAKKFLESSHG